MDVSNNFLDGSETVKQFGKFRPKSCSNYSRMVLTGYFSINRGVRQGDPLSPYLFILALEPLLAVIRENKQIHGIHAGNTDTQTQCICR